MWYIKDALVYQILLIVFTDIDAYDYVRQKKGMQDGQAVFFSIHKQYLGPDHVAKQAAEAEIKLQASCSDGERKGWD